MAQAEACAKPLGMRAETDADACCYVVMASGLRRSQEEANPRTSLDDVPLERRPQETARAGVHAAAGLVHEHHRWRSNQCHGDA